MILRLKEWGPFRDATVTLDETPGVYVVAGQNEIDNDCDSNGCGKSSLMNAIMWVRYGDFPALGAVTDVLHRNAGKGAEAKVELWDKLPDGRSIYVERVRGRKTKGLSFSVDGAPLQQWDLDDAQRKLNTLWGVNYQTFSQLVYFTGDFTFAGLSDAPMKTVLSVFAPLDTASAERLAAQALAQAKSDTAAASGASQAAARIVERAEEGLTENTGLEQAWNAENPSTVAAWENHYSEAYAALTAASTVWEGLKGLEQEALSSQARAIELRRGLREIEGALSRAAAAWTRTAQAYTAAEQAATCTACDQPIPAELYSAAVARADTQVREAAATHAALVTEIETKKPEVEAAEAAVPPAVDQIAGARSAYDAALAASNQAYAQMTQAQTAQNPYSHTVATLREGLQARRDEAAVATAEHAETIARTKLSEYVRKMLGKRGLTAFVLSQLLPRLTELTTLYLAHLSPGSGSAKFVVTQNGTFSPVVKREHGSDKYRTLSSGETRRVDCAVFLALSTMAKPLYDAPMVWVDELLDVSTDETGRQMMLEALDAYAQTTGRAVYVITNDRALRADRRRTRGTITVRKTAEGATIT